MRKIYVFFILILALFIYIGSQRMAYSSEITSYIETLSGLNNDMRETLHKIREGKDVEENTEILHDQLHLMRDILRLMKDEDENLKKLSDLNEGMREAWHNVKKNRDRKANLEKLHNQLHDMSQLLQGMRGEKKE